MEIAITGAGGFLGTELLRQLSAFRDITVTAFTFDFERERTTFIRSENIFPVDNSEAADFDFSDTDVLINCAFPRNADDASFSKGLIFLQRVIEKAAGDGVGAVINISSQSVYSQQRWEPANEDFLIITESKYAVGKYFSELFVNSVCRKIRHTNLRMASLIGAGFNQRITNKFAMKVRDGEQITISGGNQLFGFLDVRDAASGIIAAALSDCGWAEAYNLGTNEAYRLLDIAAEAVSVGRSFGYSAPDPISNESENWQNSVLDCNKFQNEFSWHPKYDLKATLSEIFKAFD
ncbi:MAG: NAD(P)-dependent oxidoreductase [Ruminococcus sp.]|nr:NAD(P)-dependent oxidoreductase [Ruminococcus sp.]